MTTADDYLAELIGILNAVPRSAVDRLVGAVLAAQRQERQVSVLGNGGSAATSSHFACDLAKGTASPGVKRLRLVALTDHIPLLTAWGNDRDYADVFAEQLQNLVREGDLVTAFGGSGTSPNVPRAIGLANEAGAVTVGLAGFEGGRLAESVQIPVVVPCSCMEQIEVAHPAVCHAVAVAVRQEFRSTLEVGVDR